MPQEMLDMVGMVCGFCIGWRVFELIDRMNGRSPAYKRIAAVAVAVMASYFSIIAYLYRIHIDPQAVSILLVGAWYSLTESIDSMLDRFR